MYEYKVLSIYDINKDLSPGEVNQILYSSEEGFLQAKSHRLQNKFNELATKGWRLIAINENLYFFERAKENVCNPLPTQKISPKEKI